MKDASWRERKRRETKGGVKGGDIWYVKVRVEGVEDVFLVKKKRVYHAVGSGGMEGWVEGWKRGRGRVFLGGEGKGVSCCR